MFETVPDFALIDGYRRLSGFDMLRLGKVPLLTVQASRGCQFKCTFCIVNTMLESGTGKRDVESVIRDLRDKRNYGRELLFVDNDFAAIRPFTKKLLTRMVEEDFGFDVMVLTRVEVARDDELLALMRRAGVTQIYQGYESVQPETLVGYDKKQTLEKIVATIDKLHSYGFRISGSFVVGADTDTLDTLDRTVQFVLDYGLTIAYFFPIWGHYPEQIRGYEAIVPVYRSIFREWKGPRRQLRDALPASHAPIAAAARVDRCACAGVLSGPHRQQSAAPQLPGRQGEARPPLHVVDDCARAS